jgi:hypothetical protein
MPAMAEGLSETSYKNKGKSHGLRVHFVEWKHRTVWETFSSLGGVNFTEYLQDCKQQAVGK